MADQATRPRLRPLEAFPATVDGRAVICLRDPSGLSGAVLAVPRPVVEVLALLDGTRTVLDIQAEIMRRHATLAPRDDLEALVATLDRHLFLEGAGLDAERARLAAAFQASPVRPASHAGRAYAEAPDALAAQLDGFFAAPDGPGPVGVPGSATIRGLVAPHIDFHRGGPAYAWAYKALADAAPADCYVVFGTAHAGLDGHPFAATHKPYDTPFGPLPVDTEVLEAFARRAPGDLFAAELAHRAEHSIEFQAVCLAYLHRDRADVRIVPLLTSFGHEALARGVEPAAHPVVAGVLGALRDTMDAIPRRYCLIAGADLAHVGPHFGDPVPLTPSDLRRVEAADRELLAVVEAGDASRFFTTVARDGDDRRICGLSPIYALLRCLPASRGRLLTYRQWPDPQGAVTFASVVFEDEEAGTARTGGTGGPA